MTKKNLKEIALYPGSFDPITYGHLDIMLRAANLFERVIIGVGYNVAKKGLIPIEQRVKMIEECIQKNIPAYKKFSVIHYSNLTVEVVAQQNVKVLIRGLRDDKDFGSELQMATMNRLLSGDLETVCMFSKPEFFHISSTLVREICQFKKNRRKNLKSLVPKQVIDYFENSR